jgi:TatD DNase family protein
MSLIDSHCHLDFPEFADDLPGLMSRAKAAGVTEMITISTRVKKFATISALAERFPQVWCTVGTHPHQAAEELDVTAEELIALSAHPRCVGIGEAGLDYHYDKSPRDVQERSFRVHIAAARRTGLPLVIHARSADARMAEVLTEEMAKGAFGAVLHCFSSGAELARLGVELGLYVSFSGIVTFKASAELRAIAAEVPNDRLLVETDAPFLAPVPHRGQRNEPAYTIETAKVLAEVRGTSLSELTTVTSTNTRRLFAKMASCGDLHQTTTKVA